MKINQLKAGIVLSYLSIALKSLVELVYTPIMLRLLGQSDYGLYSLVNSVVSYLGLLTFGVGGAYLRFYSREKAEGGEKKVAQLNGMFLILFSMIAVIALTAGMILSGNVRMVFGDKLSQGEVGAAKVLVILMSVSMAGSILNSVFTSYISAHEQYFFQRLLTIASNVLNPFLSFPLLLMGFGSLSLVLATLTLTSATLALNIWFCFRKLRMQVSFRGLQWSLLKEIYAFSFFIFLNQIIDQVNWSVDSILLGRFWGTTAVAVYGLASRMNHLYLNFSTSISSVFAPRINRIVAEKKNVTDQLLALMIRVGRIQGILLLLLLMGLTMLGRPFLYWLGGDDAYLESYPVMLFLIVPVIIPLVQNIGLEIQRAMNKHQFRSVIYAGMAVINVCVSLVLVTRYGAAGAAAGTAVSLIVANGFVMNWYYHVHLGLNMRTFWLEMSSLVRGAILPALYCTVCMIITDPFDPIIFLATGAGLVLIYAISMWHWGINDYEKSLVIRTVQKLTHRKVEAS